MTNRAWPLYSAAFLMALALSMVWTVMSFIVSGMGGGKAHAGYAPAVNTLAYMLALFVVGSLSSRLHVKRATLWAGAGSLLATVAMAGAVLAARSSLAITPLAWIWAIILSGGIGGAAMAFYWPLLMAWVSADYEGVRLNRRFGRYNSAWSSGGTIGPVLGAWLVETGPALPLLVAAAFIVLGILALSSARDGTVRTPGASAPADIPHATCGTRALVNCRWISRIALFNACLCFAMIRSQFALVFTDLGFAESQFGVYQTIYALCTFAVLVAAGRWALWHFKPALLAVAQLLLIATLLMVIRGRTLPVFFASSILLGAAYAFAYSSHLYYGASTSRRRSARMALHEITIALGLTVGAAAGGYLCEHVGTYAPYWFATGVVGLGIVAQIAIHLASPAKAGIPAHVPTVPRIEPTQ